MEITANSITIKQILIQKQIWSEALEQHQIQINQLETQINSTRMQILALTGAIQACDAFINTASSLVETDVPVSINTE